jgi:hypothetical protein
MKTQQIECQLTPGSGLKLLHGYVDTGVCTQLAAVDFNKPLNDRMRYVVQLDGNDEMVHLTLFADGTWSVEATVAIQGED